MVSLHAFLLAAALTGSNDAVLLHFTADWCGPCRQMEPTIQRLRDAGYPIRDINVDREAELTRQHRVGPIPCFVLLRDGREVDRLVGAASYDRLVRMYEPPRSASAAGAPIGPVQPTLRGQSPDLPPTPLTRLPDAGFSAHATAPPVGPGDATGRLAPPAPASVHQDALRATVRLCVRDARGQSHGTGTIIDAHGDEALVLTCGHIFRASQGQGEILVELCLPEATGPVRGTLVAYEAEDRDIGLVSIRPGLPVRPVRVASTDFRPEKGTPVFSVGCDHGAAPTVRESTISAVDRYIGASNFEVLGHPVEGRSGGGLFAADGRLIGVCNAADHQEDRGIYAGLPTIHYELTAINQQRIFAGGPAEPAPPPAALADDRLSAIDMSALPASGAMIGEAMPPSAPADATEVICIVRSRAQGPQGERVIVINTPSAALLKQLEQAAQYAPAGAVRPGPPATFISDAGPRPAPAAPPVLRGQNY